MSILTDELPNSIIVKGKKIKINCSFKASIAFETMMCNPDVTDEHKTIKMLSFYLPQYERFFSEPIGENTSPEFTHIIKNATLTVERLLDFYRGGMPMRMTKSGLGASAVRIYDYDFDASYIFASFWQAYGIDLTENNLHWWKFKALFYALPENTVIKQIMSYRTKKVSSSMSAEEKSHIRRMKKIYALPKYASSEELAKEEQLVAVLLGDGDLSQMVD